MVNFGDEAPLVEVVLTNTTRSAEALRTVSAEARGKLRTWKAAATRQYAQFDKLYGSERMQALVHEFAGRGSHTGRIRALKHLRRLFEPPAVFQCASSCKYPVACWLLLKPREGVAVEPDDPSLLQDCVSVDYFTAGLYDGSRTVRTGTGLWSLEVTDHALHRLLMRAPGVDLRATLIDAHYYAINLPYQINKDSFWVRGGPGWFICEVRFGFDVSRNEDTSWHVRAMTWLHDDQLTDRQEKELLFPVSRGSGDPRLGDLVLLPAPLFRFDAVSKEFSFVEPNTLPPLPYIKRTA